MRFGFFLFFIIAIGCKKKCVTPAINDASETIIIPKGMVWVPSKTFLRGAKPEDYYAMVREKPAFWSKVEGFFIDVTEVTNRQFRIFVDATNYQTVAERSVDWNLLKLQLPKNTPKPHDTLLQPGSLVFNKQANNVVSMDHYHQWWRWMKGANWKHPEGLGSSIKDRDNHPVVHIAYEDALAYCKWANRTLPTETQWESAAQGSFKEAIYTWGNDVSLLNTHANTWQGSFPEENKATDGFAFIAAVKSYPPNSIGLHDMLGNVWELTNDAFHAAGYKAVAINSKNKPKKAYDSIESTDKIRQNIQYTVKGGSFLCHASYCASFRISARMGVSFDSSADHTGFRTVVTKEMLSSGKN